MEHMMRLVCRRWLVVIAFLGLSMLGIIDLPPVAAQGGPGTLCVLQIAADGTVMGVLADQVENFNLAVLVPADKKMNVPVTCSSLETLGLGVSNQKNTNVNVTAQVLTNNGEVICSKGPFQLAVNGARGFIFSDSDCQLP
jgi:hypothetical protein